MGFARGDIIFLLGETREELSGSEWAWVTHGHLGGLPPKVDLLAERRLSDVIRAANQLGLLRTAHDLSDGGLAQALAEACLRNGYGATVQLPSGSAFVHLFSESAGRAVVSVPLGLEKAFTNLCEEHEVPWQGLGVVGNAGAPLEVAGEFTIPLAELRQAWEATMPALFATPLAQPLDDDTGRRRRLSAAA